MGNAIFTTGTLEMLNLGTAAFVLRVKNFETAKVLRIATSGAITVTGIPFQPDQQHFGNMTLSAGTVQQNYTYVAGEIDFNLSPLAVQGNIELPIVITNVSGATQRVQVWLLT